MTNPLIQSPQSLTFITTYKCSASCPDCCFECSPERFETINIADFSFYLDHVLSIFPSLKIVVLTGGECFLLKDLYNMVKLSNQKGLLVRIVTNGYWANTLKSATSILHKLKMAGLTEINFSTGDDHLKFVSMNKIVNGVVASLELGLTTVVNVESGPNRTFLAENLKKHPKIKPYLSDRKKNTLSIVNGYWAPFTFESLNLLRNSEGFSLWNNKTRCKYLFKTITITPLLEVIACCGLPSIHLPSLKLGKLDKHNLKELYDSQYLDFLKIWLYVDGPYKILSFIADKLGEEYVPELKALNMHPCLYCASILGNELYLQTIKKHYRTIYSSILLRYFILTKSNK